MKPPLYIAFHQGLGDAIICCGLIRKLAQSNDWIVVPSKWVNLRSVEEIFSDLKNVTVMGVDSDQESRKWVERFVRGGSQVLKLGIFRDEPLRSDWDRQFYDQAGVDFEERWRGFKVPMDCSLDRIHKLDNPEFFHDDPDRGFVIDSKRTGCGRLGGSLPITPSIWSYLERVQFAKEIHVIDSCFLCMADSVPTKAKKLVLHQYAMAEAKPMGPPTLRKNWTILT